jgi:3-isopropylmalate dehydrogenase
MKPSYDLAVLPGDGIGPEVMAAALSVLHAAAQRAGRSFRAPAYAAGAGHYRATGVALPDATLDACRSADAILFGAMGLPDVRGADGTEVIPQLDIRFALDLYAGVRPVRTWPGLQVPLADPRAAAIDLVLVRESTEGLFYARGRGVVTPDDAQDTMRITRSGTARVADFALRLARQRKARGRPGRLTSVDKANVFRSMAFWRDVVHERAAAFPDIVLEDAYVDAMALNLVLKPWQYDVLVTENMFGDILSDLIASLVGGMGMAPSADIGDHWGLFQPAHGTAPDITGQGIANPTAMVLSAALMLDWLAERHADAALADAAAAIERAVHLAFETGAVRPREFGGQSTTADIARAVLERL